MCCPSRTSGIQISSEKTLPPLRSTSSAISSSSGRVITCPVGLWGLHSSSSSPPSSKAAASAGPAVGDGGLADRGVGEAPPAQAQRHPALVGDAPPTLAFDQFGDLLELRAGHHLPGGVVGVAQQQQLAAVVEGGLERGQVVAV